MSRRGRVVAFVASVAMATGIGSGLWLSFREPPEARAAREAVAARRGDEARRLLDRWAAVSPRGGEPDYYRALLEVQADRPAEALDAMRRSIALGHPEPPLAILQAVVMARAGKFEQAEPILARAFEQGSEPRAEVAEGLARIYLKSFRLAETLRVLEAWMKAAPDDARPYLLRNEVDERTNAEPSVIVRNYREAIRRDPGLLNARLGLAEKLRDGSQLEEAEAEYTELLRRDPRNVRALAGAGRIALLQGDLTSSVRLFEQVLAVDPGDKAALRELGLIDMNMGRIPQACDRLKRAVEADPYDPEAHYSYSRALKLAGNPAGAAEEAAATDRLKKEQQKIIDLRQSLVQRPDDVDLRCEAARWLIEHGHEKEGLEWTGLVLRQRPGHPPTCKLLVEYYTGRGELGLANFYRLNSSPASPGH